MGTEIVMASGNHILIQKLDEFIRKYYKNLLIRGSLYALGLLLSAFLCVVLLNYFGEFGIGIRTALFFSFLALTLLVLVKYIAIPLMKLNRIGEVISYEDAASIIGTHFGNVQDKLLNVLQLQKQQAMIGSEELLLAGINQKIKELQPVPFSAAIDLKENKRYLKYVLPVLFLFTGIYIIWPAIIHKGTARLVNYQTYYVKEMPFTFNVLNDDLSALQTQDFQLNVKVSGNEIPNEVFIKVNNIEYKLEKADKINFTHVFKNVQSDLAFSFSAAGFETDNYTLKVLPKPVITKFNARLVFPSYLNKPEEILNNAGDMQIPQGTKVYWNFNTQNTSNLQLQFSDTIVQSQQNGKNDFIFSRRFMAGNQYVLKATNQLVKKVIDSVAYLIQVVPDQYPQIDLSASADSLNPKNIYLSGSIKDDYGFSKLHLFFKKYTTDSLNNKKESVFTFPLNIQAKQIAQTYYHYINLTEFNLKPGDKVEYYTEVFDNDGVNGNKSARSAVQTYKAPSMEEISDLASKNNAEIKKDLEESINKAKQLQKDVNDIARKLNEKTQMGYEEKKKIEELMNKQKQLQNKIEEIKQENQQNNQMQNEFSPQDESILEKQQELEKLFEQIMTPEMKKLFEELQKAMNQLDKNQVQQKLEEIKLNSKDLEKELDRNLELFKQLEVQQKMQEAIDKLDELKNKQEQLKNETENKDNKNSDSKKLEEKQNDLNKEFDKLKEDLKDLQKKNEQLEEPNALPNNEKKQDAISKEMQKSADQLNKDNKKDAAKSQEDAAKKMEEMKEEMEQAMEENEQQQQEENAQTLRQILENLLHVSFQQEDLMKQLGNTRIDNPNYVKIPQQQKKLKDDSKIIEDSLLALSKRVPSISSLINREISSINNNMDKTIKSLAERNVSESSIRMQSSMTSVNNLALLLNESLEQMQKQMKSKQPGKSGKCKKPGSGKGENPSDSPSIPNMRKLQEQLNKQLQDLKKAMENGQKPGEKPGEKPGNKPGQKPGGSAPGQQGKSGFDIPGSSEQFAKMAAQQEAIRRQIQQLMEKLKNKGSNPGGDITELMEQTEKELVNKNISNEMIKRQNDILTKLLESEKAEREREQDEKRKSNEAKNQNYSNPAQFLEYKRLKEKELELINTLPPGLTPFYKEKVNSYFNNVNKEN